MTNLTATFLTAAALWALPAQALGGPTRQGTAKGRSSVSSFAACEAAKERANAPHCGAMVAAEKAIGRCVCVARDDGWTCRVRWAEMCQDGDPRKTSRAVTSTHQGRSTQARVDACFAAEVDARRHSCPDDTLARELGPCVCEQSGTTHRCLIDQTLWCHR